MLRSIQSIFKKFRIFLIPIVIFSILIVAYEITTFGRIAYGVYVDGVNLSLKSTDEAFSVLSKNIPPEKIVLIGGDKKFELKTQDFGVTYDLPTTIERSYNLTRTGNIVYDLYNKFRLFFFPKKFGFSIRINEGEMSRVISSISAQVSESPVYPKVTMTGNIVSVEKGAKGSDVETSNLRLKIGEALAFGHTEEIQIPVTMVDPTLTQEEANKLKERIEKYIGKNIIAKFEFDSFNYPSNEIVKLLGVKGGVNDDELSKITTKVAVDLKRDPQNSKFNFENGKVVEFLPAKDGIEVNTNDFKNKIIEALDKLETDKDIKNTTIEIPVNKTPPQVTTSEVNDLGIKELIGRGTSKFRGSIPSRVHNVVLASSRLNGILIKPGETLSFNETLGDVSKFTGFQEAYVIREGKTVLGDGGGVCQVSTTLFRAALNAGLPIAERQAHAYRVGYYEQDSGPGLDATVYGPSPDLKIKNDTSAHILIQAKADAKNYSLIFELYGTNDGRVSTVKKPIITKITPAGEDVYIDDPNLPSGVVRQTEHRAQGARVTFNYNVVRNGETLINRDFVSNYRPWQAVYLRGTGPVQ